MNNILANLGNLGGAGGPAPLVELKAGKMNFDGRLVKADRRRGLIRLVKDISGMTQFQWCDADTKNPIDNLYVFPGDCKFEKVKQSKDRVYLLEFKSTEQRFFYWIQEEDKEKDAEWMKKVSNVLDGKEANEGITPASTTSA